MPLAEGVVSVCNQVCEYLCVRIARKSYYIHKEIEDDNEKETSNVVGFQAPTITTEEDDEEYD